MQAVFLKLFNLSIQASWLALAVLVLRFLLGRTRAPKSVRVLMWGLVGLRLVCPFSIQSVISLMPSRQTLTVDTASYARAPSLHTGVGVIDRAVNPVMSQLVPAGPTTVPGAAGTIPAAPAAVNPLETALTATAWVWLAGMAAMVLYFALSALRLRRQVAGAVRVKGPVWESDRIPSPFVFGFFRPRVYLPVGMAPEHRAYVLAHETAHIRRRDHLVKPLAFLILAVYWFNPVIWLAYVLLCRDIELACDEHVLAELGPRAKKPYSRALLAAVTFHRHVAACPVAFGEGKLKGRVKNVLRWKRSVVWVTAASVVLCGVLAACFLTDPKSDNIAGAYIYSAPDQDPAFAPFGITLKEDGSFTYMEGLAASYIGMGTWEEKDGLVTLTDTASSRERTLLFRWSEEGLRYVAEGSDSFMYVQVPDGGLFVPEDQYTAPETPATPDTPGTEPEAADPVGSFVNGDWALLLREDGTYAYVGPVTSDLMGLGTWRQEGDTVTLGDELGGVHCQFRLTPEGLQYIAEGSSFYADLTDGAVFARRDDYARPVLSEAAYQQFFQRAARTDGAPAEEAGVELYALYRMDPERFLGILGRQTADVGEPVAALLFGEASFDDLDAFQTEIETYAASGDPDAAAGDPDAAAGAALVQGVMDRWNASESVQPRLRGTGEAIGPLSLDLGSSGASITFEPMPDWVPSRPLMEGSPLPEVTGEQFEGFESLTIPTLSAWKLEIRDSGLDLNPRAEVTARSIWGDFRTEQVSQGMTAYRSPSADTQWGPYGEAIYVHDDGRMSYQARWEDVETEPFLEAPEVELAVDVAAARSLAARLGLGDIALGDPVVTEDYGNERSVNWPLTVDGLGGIGGGLYVDVCGGYAHTLELVTVNCTFITYDTPSWFLTPDQALYCVNYARSQVRPDWDDCGLLEAPNPLLATMDWERDLGESTQDVTVLRPYYVFVFESDPIRDGPDTYTSRQVVLVDPFTGDVRLTTHEESYESPYTLE